MAIGDLFNVQVQYAIDSKELSCNFGYEQTAGATDSEVSQLLGDAFVLAVKAALLAVWATDVKLQCVVVHPINAATAVSPGFIYAVAADVGSRSGTAIPAPSAMVLKFLTSAPDAKKNGRKFLAGLSESDLVNGLFAGGAFLALVATLETALKAILFAISPNDQEFTPRVINRVSGGVPIVPPTGSSVTDVTALAPVYSQIRRKTKRTASPA